METRLNWDSFRLLFRFAKGRHLPCSIMYFQEANLLHGILCLNIYVSILLELYICFF